MYFPLRRYSPLFLIIIFLAVSPAIASTPISNSFHYQEDVKRIFNDIISNKKATAQEIESLIDGFDLIVDFAENELLVTPSSQNVDTILSLSREAHVPFSLSSINKLWANYKTDYVVLNRIVSYYGQFYYAYFVENRESLLKINDTMLRNRIYATTGFYGNENDLDFLRLALVSEQSDETKRSILCSISIIGLNNENDHLINTILEEAPNYKNNAMIFFSIRALTKVDRKDVVDFVVNISKGKSTYILNQAREYLLSIGENAESKIPTTLSQESVSPSSANTVEEGDLVYREIDLNVFAEPFIGFAGHVGMIIEVDSSDPLDSKVSEMHTTGWREKTLRQFIYDNSSLDYYGMYYHSSANTAQKRSLAVGYNLVLSNAEYPPWYKYTYWYKEPNENPPVFRCDGLVEYCYEMAMGHKWESGDNGGIVANDYCLTLWPTRQMNASNMYQKVLDIPKPSVNSNSASNISSSSARLNGNVTSDGGFTVTARGFYFSRYDSTPDSGDTVYTVGSGTGLYYSYVSSLSPYTTYYYRAFATNSKGTTLGTVKTFTTLGNFTKPSVSTNTATNITSTSARLNGSVPSDGGATVTARGFYFSANDSTPDSGDSVFPAGSGTGSFYKDLTSILWANTTYYYRAFATNSQGTAEGSVRSFTTPGNITEPFVSTSAATNITSTSARLNGNVTSDGGATVTARGFYLSITDSTPDSNDTVYPVGSGTGSFYKNVSSLNNNTTYYYRAYATNSQGTEVGYVMSFSTSSNITKPSVTTNAASNVTSSSARLNADVTSDGGATVTSRGFYYSSTDATPDSNDTVYPVGSGTGSFYKNVSSLSPSTTYYYRAWATNSQGTEEGSVLSFSTSSNITKPSVTTDSASNITSSSARLNADVTSDGGYIVTERGFYFSSTNTTPDDGDKIYTVGSGTGLFYRDVSTLSPNTTYYFSAFATNNQGTTVGSVRSFTTAAGGPVVWPGPDAYGYVGTKTTEEWESVSSTGTQISFPDDDNSSTSIPIGFTFPFYGNKFSQVYVHTNGYMSFTDSSWDRTNNTIPGSSEENLIAPWWDDLTMDYHGYVYYEVRGTAPNRRLIVHWRAEHSWYSDPNSTRTFQFQAKLYEGSGKIVFAYFDVYISSGATDVNDGNSATIGIQDGTSTIGLMYNYKGSNPVQRNDALIFTHQNIPPENVSVSPSDSNGYSQTFAAKYIDENGPIDLRNMYLKISSGTGYSYCAYVRYRRVENDISLRNDAGSAWLPVKKIGSTGTVENSQVKIDISQVNTSISNNIISLYVPMLFKPKFVGQKKIFLQAIDFNGGIAAWEQKGTYTVTSSNAIPVNVSVTPNSGSGQSQTFTARYSDVDGWKDIRYGYFKIADSSNSNGKCVYIRYRRATNKLDLRSDTGGSWLGGYVIGSSRTLKNNQVSIDIAKVTTSKNGISIALTLPLQFKTAFTGNYIVYLNVYDMAYATPGWKKMGIQTVVIGNVPINYHLTPTVGSGGWKTFKAIYKDYEGCDDLKYVYFKLAPSLTSSDCVYVRYRCVTKKLDLRSTTGGSWINGPVVGTNAWIKNGRVSINLANVRAPESGKYLNIVLPLVFKSGFSGQMNTYMYCYDKAGNNSGWKKMGTFTVTTSSSTNEKAQISLSSLDIVPGERTFFNEIFDGNENTELSINGKTIKGSDPSYLFKESGYYKIGYLHRTDYDQKIIDGFDLVVGESIVYASDILSLNGDNSTLFVKNRLEPATILLDELPEQPINFRLLGTVENGYRLAFNVINPRNYQFIELSKANQNALWIWTLGSVAGEVEQKIAKHYFNFPGESILLSLFVKENKIIMHANSNRLFENRSIYLTRGSITFILNDDENDLSILISKMNN